MIHPLLIYSNNEFDKKKLEFQDKLRFALQHKKITNQEFIQYYKKIKDMCIQKKIKKDQTEYNFKQELNNILNNIEDEENNKINNEINIISMQLN